jgi:hypothetical protein
MEEMRYEAYIRPGGEEKGKESTVQNATAGGKGMAFMVKPLQETSGEV